MTIIRKMSEAHPADLKAGRNHLVIDLSGATSAADAMARIGAVLRGADSPHIQGGSLDALYDVVSDWMLENSHVPQRVTLTHASALTALDPLLLPRIIACLDMAQMLAISLSKTPQQALANLRLEIFV
ncbi:barstar family protein [Xanthobacteraceae bacterium A53D]